MLLVLLTLLVRVSAKAGLHHLAGAAGVSVRAVFGGPGGPVGGGRFAIHPLDARLLAAAGDRGGGNHTGEQCIAGLDVHMLPGVDLLD